MQQITITLTGPTLENVIAQAALLGKTQSKTAATTTTTTAAPKTATKKAAAPVAEELEETELLGADDETSDDVLGFDDAGVEEEIEEEVKPKAAKTTKAAKITEKEVNAAALAYAKEHGRPAALKILSTKFKVKSILELKPEQYASVIKALAV